MADWMDGLSAIVDSGVPEAANNGLDAFSALDTGSGILAAGNGLNGDSSSLLGGLADWAKANPQLAGSLFGAAGPLAGLLGNLGANGVNATTAGSQNESLSGTQTKTDSSQQQRTSSGFNNQTNQQTLDPAAQAAMDRLTAMYSGNAAGAQGAYDKGLSLMGSLADQGSMGQGAQGYAQPGAPNTTPTPSATGDFPSQLPTDYNAGIGNLIKQAFGSFMGDLGSQAITNARGRGFAGGADLLNSAAAPMMGQSLAQVPAMEAKAYLDHVLQAYDLQSQNASRESGANAAALNAGTNALGPGVTKYGMDVQKYGIDRSQDNNQLGQLTSLLNSLMGPQRDLMTGNQNLLTGAPRGSTQNTLSGGQENQTLSGTSQTTNQQQTQRNTTGSQSTPIPNVIGQGVANIVGGAGQGAVAGGAPDFTGAAARNNPNPFASLLASLQKKA